MIRTAVVVGSGPNGLAAAIVLAEAGVRVSVLERDEAIGGGARTEGGTLPGFLHDVCSAVHPMGAASPFFRRLPLEGGGLRWIHPDLPLAHPLDGGRAAALHRSLDETARGLDGDGPAWRGLVERTVERWDDLVPSLLAPLFPLPRRPFLMLGFARRALRSARGTAGAFRGEAARALFAGLAAHAVLPLDRPASAAVGVVLGAAAHAVGWPFPEGGAGRISGALADHLRRAGGTLRTGTEVRSLEGLGDAEAALFDVAPASLARIAGAAFPGGYRRRLERFRYGPGAFKIDWALDGPIPWEARECRRAGTVHVGGTFEEIASAEAAPWRGETAERPFVLLAQPTLFDPSRAPSGKHTAWAYCHVPAGSREDMTARIEAQVERFAPGFGKLVLARATRTAADLEARNPNLVGGDVTGGVNDLRQTLGRPVWSANPYATPDPRIWLCSASTPPGGGVHGMCGANAARSLLEGRRARRLG